MEFIFTILLQHRITIFLYGCVNPDISPGLLLTGFISVSITTVQEFYFTWWWSESYNYFVVFNNGDVFTEVKNIAGGDWIVLWNENEAGTFIGFE